MTTELSLTETDFIGSLYYKNEHTICVYCDKYYVKPLFLGNNEYCAHCWGWVCNLEINLAEGTYSGQYLLNDILKYIKLTYPIHTKTCTNEDCIYHKIQHYYNTNKLHKTFVSCIEIKKEKIFNAKTLNKNTKLKVNYKLVSINI